MAEQVSSHTPEVGGVPQPKEVNTPVSPREERILGKLTGVIRQTLEEHKKSGDKIKEKAHGESSKGEMKHSSFKDFKSSGASEMLIREAIVWWEATYEALCDNRQFSVQSKSNKVYKSNRSTQLTLVYYGLHYVYYCTTPYLNEKNHFESSHVQKI